MDDDGPPTRDDRPYAKRIQDLPTEPAVQTGDEPIDPGGRYVEHAEIARGGMGRVIEATDLVLGRSVALKAALSDDADAMRRFARETRVTARLEHPSIVPVYDAGRTKRGVPYYVMRKVDGRPLDQLVQERRTVDARLALVPNVLAAIEAIAHAHARGVIHRDLKPTNILVGELGETIVIDWGLAKVIDEEDDEVGARDSISHFEASDSLQTRVGTVIGTPGFMSPEQLRGDATTRASDVYALGCTLYHVLGGAPPHAGRSSDEMIANAVAGPPRPLVEVAPGVPRDLVAIVERAMTYDDRVRYVDAGALATDLRRFLTGQLVASHAYSSRERLVRFVRRHRAAVVIGAIATTLVGALAVIAVTNIVRERNLAKEAQELALVEKLAAEEARAREAQRADDLLVSKAAALLATNPTASVGLLHQLPAASQNWRKARGVLADARSRGVPWVLPASGGTSGLVVTRDGKLAYSAGIDGIVRRHDLVAHTTQVILTATGTVLLELAGDERHLAITDDGNDLVWLDVATGSRARVTLAGHPEHLAVAGDAAIVVVDRALWQVRRGDAPAQLPFARTDVFALKAAPDHERVLVLARPESFVFELAKPAITFRRGVRLTTPAWSADGKRLALAHVQGLDEVDFSTTPPALRSIPLGTTSATHVMASAYVGEDLYFSTADRIYRHHASEGTVQLDVPSLGYTIAVATRDAAVFVSQSGTVAVVGRGNVLAIRAPVLAMYRSAANPSAARFVVSTHDWLLSYDTAAFLPRVIDDSIMNTSFNGFTDARHFLLARMVEDWRLYDVEDGARSVLPGLLLGRYVGAAPDGSFVLAVADKSRALTVLRANKPPEPLGEARGGAVLSATQIAVATERAIAIHDLATGARTQAWQPTGEITWMAAHPPFLAAATATQLWRRDQRTGATSTTKPPIKPVLVDAASDGSVVFATAREVWRWNPDHTVERLALLDTPVRRVFAVAGYGALALDSRLATYRVDGGPPEIAIPAGIDIRRFARTAPVAAVLSEDRRLAIYDLEARHEWSLGVGATIAEVSPDGTYAATMNGNRIVIYKLAIPADRATYQALLDASTNLRTGGTANDVVWPPR